MDFLQNTLTMFLFPLAEAQQLLEPIGGMTDIPRGQGVTIIQQYIQNVWPWLIGIGIGLVLLRIVIGGVELMNAGGNPGVRAAAREHIKWAIIGLLMLVGAGAILATINPSAYGVM